jgi:hypothetical protein
MSIHRTHSLLVQAIDLRSRSRHRRGRSRQSAPSAPATGQGEPLGCCLRYAEPSELITLISYAPFERPSVWKEVGPVYVHAEPCAGYTPTGRLPEQLAPGPRVLGTYRADDTMNYEHNTVVTDETDLQPIIEDLLTQPDVATVHVRTLAAPVLPLRGRR